MAASDPSKYDKINLEASDQSETVDLRLGAVSIDYYEDIFSPSITAKIVVTSSGPVVKGKSIYQGLPLRGGERIEMKILGNTSSNPGLDFSKTPDDYLYVSGISGVVATNEQESFTLNLCSKVAITNETVRVTKKFPTSQNITGSVEKIVNDYLGTGLFAGPPDQTENKYGFVGNMRKPFTVLRWLASKSVPDLKGDGVAGFLFFQTKEGLHFKSVDKMITRDPVAKYVETLVADGNNKDVTEDFKITSYFVERNQNMVENLRLGAYASQRYYFDFHAAQFTREQDGLFKISDFSDSSKNLGSKQGQLPKLSPTSTKTLSDVPTRVMTGFIDKGTMEIEVDKTPNADPFKYQSQTLYRYNSLLTQKVRMTVPSNTNLSAGDIIECEFRRVATGKEERDPLESGLYMIKELCHHFDAQGSYTSMTLVRDTFGAVKPNNKV